MNLGLLVATIISISTSILDELPRQFTECVQFEDAEKRLQCFDSITKQFILDEKSRRVQPSTEFLESELRVDKNRSDYRLKINQFIAMLTVATLDNGKPIKIIGWERQEDHYTLVIRMRSITRLQFTHSHNAKANFCVLAPVLVDGEVVDPALFVINIAAMTPDE